MFRSYLMRGSFFLITVASLQSVPLPLSGQTVKGLLLDTELGTPVQGALVLLVDGEEEVRGGYLTDEGGAFLLQTPGPGRYTLRVERIGYRTTTTLPFTVRAGETREFKLETVQSPIELEGLIVGGEGRCVVRPEEGLQVAKVWEEARKALANQEWASRGGRLAFQVARYQRELDLDGRVMREGPRETASFIGRTPIRSLPPEDLSESGYVRQHESGGYDYFGPDARVLLSDHFLDTHCFRLVEDPDNPDMVGLSFDPIRKRRIPDIQGTFWLHRKTATLTLLEFKYTWAPWTAAQGVGRGRVEFGILPGGAWVIQRWWIRMPMMVLDHAIRRMGGDGLRVNGIVEEGEEVLKITLLGKGRIVETITATPPSSVPHEPEI